VYIERDRAKWDMTAPSLNEELSAQR